MKNNSVNATSTFKNIIFYIDINISLQKYLFDFFLLIYINIIVPIIKIIIKLANSHFWRFYAEN